MARKGKGAQRPMSPQRLKFLPQLSLLVVFLMVLVACGAQATATTGTGGAATAAATSPAVTGGGATAVATTAARPPAAASPAGGQTAGPANYGFKPQGGSRVDQVSLGAPVEITFWHTQTAAREEKLKKIVADFEAKNPNIKVKLELQGSYNDLFKKNQAAITGGGLPDLSVAYENQVSEYQAADVVVPLDDYINSQKYGLSAEELNDFYPVYITSNQYPEYKGAMLSFPFTKSVLVMYYNADKLKEAGLEVPKTWDEFAAACKKFTGDVKGLVIHVDASTFDGFVFSRGGELINQDQTQWLLNEPQGVETLTF